VLRETNRRRFGEAPRIAVVADGAPWIWNITRDLLPGAIQSVDRFHLKQTLH
jgi:transposase